VDAIWLQAQPGGGLGFLVPFGAMLLIFYFLLIRPQARKQREQEKMLASIGKGDRVVTSGGIHGLVVGAEKDVITLEIAALKSERVRIKLDRARIERRIESAEKGAKAEEKGES
jgi:preprotein translocase subunit YajC